MIRPDLVPSGSTENRHYIALNLGGFTVHNYSDIKSLQIRLLLLKYNQLYGSLFELHISKKDKVKLQYFDIMFLRCLSIYIVKGWFYLDESIARFVRAKFWKQLLTFLNKHVFPDRKSHFRR